MLIKEVNGQIGVEFNNNEVYPIFFMELCLVFKHKGIDVFGLVKVECKQGFVVFRCFPWTGAIYVYCLLKILLFGWISSSRLVRCPKKDMFFHESNDVEVTNINGRFSATKNMMILVVLQTENHKPASPSTKMWACFHIWGIKMRRR